MADIDDSIGMQNAPTKTSKSKSKTGSAVASAGRSLNESSVDELRDQAREAGERSTPSYKRGGTKRGKGKARLHEGERILPAKMKSKRKKGRMGGRS